MSFVISTRAGFEELVPRIDTAGAVLHLAEGLASEDEIALLRKEGATVHLLAAGASIAAHDHAASVFVEQAPAVQQPTVAAEDPQPASIQEEEEHEGLHHRLARTAGSLATAAFRTLRSAGDGDRGQLMVLPYLGFGNATRLWIKGRVLDERSYREQTSDDSRWSNLVALYQRLESDEVEGARVFADFEGQRYEAVTDSGGYFEFEIPAPQGLAGGWHEVDLELPDSRDDDGSPVRAQAEVIVPGPSARFGIISDIDDTVLWTNVTNKLNMAMMLARSNSHTRKPFKGVAAFYRALVDGAGGSEANPVFYVSSSPWHLFGPLVDFLRMQDIPVGPLLLRELGMRQILKLTNHGSHKLEKIELILSFYPDMQFVLIGDSGEKDPEIYTEIVKRHPKSVRVIYIRNVNPDPTRIEALDRLIEEVSATGIQLILAPDSVFAASHAAAEGLIHVDRLALVRSDKKEDDRTQPPG